MYLNESYETAGNDVGIVSYYEGEENSTANYFEENDLDEQIFFEPREKAPEQNKRITSKLQSELVACPFCRSENDRKAVICFSCRTMLTLSDLEMLLAHVKTDQEILRQAIERMELEKHLRPFSATELKILAVGQINLKNLPQGFAYLQQALQMTPNDVVLSAQVNALAICLTEIRQQRNIHDLMPKGRTILVGDDSETVRSLLSGKLKKSGHDVLCAADGVDALEKINANLPDLVFLDVSMPRMDGYQVCKMIRCNNQTKNIPVVLISDKDGFLDKVRGRLAGTTGYIVKPFGPERLMHAVETYII